MEIAPIAGIRVMTQPKARPADSELTALFDIEAAARPGDDTYTGNRRKAAGAEDADDDVEQAGDDFDDALSREPASARQDDGSEQNSQNQISFFA